MSNFDPSPPPRTRPRRQSGGRADVLWNVLTVLVLVSMLCAGGFILSIFANPLSPFNPFPPPTLPAMLMAPTATWTPIQLEPTWTFTPTIEPSTTPTRRPTITPFPSSTPFPSITPRFKPTLTRTPTYTPKPAYPFTASISPYESTIIHPEAACNWMGVGGQVYDLKNNPVVGLIVHLGGTLNGKTVDMTTVSGTAPLYGQGGFEFVLGAAPLASKDTLFIELLDQQALPLSGQVLLTTYEDCKKNLLIVRFKQVK